MTIAKESKDESQAETKMEIPKKGRFWNVHKLLWSWGKTVGSFWCGRNSRKLLGCLEEGGGFSEHRLQFTDSAEGLLVGIGLRVPFALSSTTSPSGQDSANVDFLERKGASKVYHEKIL